MVLGVRLENFNPQKLRWLRESKSVPMKQMADQLGVSAAQVHRLETGQRRLTVDMLLRYCRVLRSDPSQLLSTPARVPVIGLVDSEHEIQPVSQAEWQFTPAPFLVADMEHVAAMRWEPTTGRFGPMRGHLLFVYRNVVGVSNLAWGKRCLIERGDGSQRLGWPIREGSATHIDGVEGRAEFNVDIAWATPLLAVVPPFVIQRLETEHADLEADVDDLRHRRQI
ncbi:MAG: helix-turn-helix domain-containing protein [Pseudomonadales bacterium]